MKKKLVPLLLVVLVVAAAIAIPALARTRSVTVDDDFFGTGRSKTVTINKGDRVNWRWVGSNPHNVTFTTGPRTCRSRGRAIRCRSTTKRSGRYGHTFKKAGTYRILCTVHAPGMKHTVKVRR